MRSYGRFVLATALCLPLQGQGLGLTGEGGAPIQYVVPLGIDAPAGAHGAFRVSATLPVGVNDELAKQGRQLSVDVTVETLPEFAAPAMPDGHPRSRVTVPLRPLYPPELHAKLRMQRGANRMQSPVIIAIADPRASIHYTWPPGADKRAAGCFNCDRPSHLAGKTEADGVYELYTNGRHIAVAPAANLFAGTPYAYLGERGRLSARVGTVMADTIRPPAVRVAAQQPPIAGGMLQEAVYLHSGELEVAGNGFSIPLVYRSRTIGPSPAGAGWDAPIFQRLRVLPNGDVEYRDGLGEIWLFRRKSDGYEAPAGLFLRLAPTSRGWSLVDQKFRETRFDELGRLISVSDEFFDANKPGSGNTTHFLYGPDGNLATIVDAHARPTTVRWEKGLLREVTDWRSRVTRFEHDDLRLLRAVQLPDVAAHKPRVVYGYAPSSGGLNARLELASNLVSIHDTEQRVTFAYTGDQVTSQKWGTGEAATFAYPSPSQALVTDALGQERRYTVTLNDTGNLLADRAHVTELRELSVPVWSGAKFGELPAGVLLAAPPATANVDRLFRFVFKNGVLESSEQEGTGKTIFAWNDKPVGAPGMLLDSATSSGEPSLPSITQTLLYQSVNNGAAFLAGVRAGDKTIHSVEPHRNTTKAVATNSSVTGTRTFDARGRLTDVASEGGTDPGSAGAATHIDYFGGDAPLHARGLPWRIREGADLVTTIEYPNATTTRRIDPRGVITTTETDAWDRPVRIDVRSPDDPLELTTSLEYDVAGRLFMVSEKKGTDLVATTFAYDAVGRRFRTTRTGLATVGSATTTIVYAITGRTVTTTHPAGAS
jgi:YD repeat-containing protein